MARQVLVLHPAHARFVPRGGRVERDGFFPVHTPVMLPEMDPSEFVQAGALARPADPAWHERDYPPSRPLLVARGALWTVLHAQGNRVTADGLVRFLEGRVHPDGEDDEIHRHFFGTPLLADWEGYRGSRGRGELARARQVLRDDAGGAVAGLADFVAGNVATCAGYAVVRVRDAVARLQLARTEEEAPRGVMDIFARRHHEAVRVAPLDRPDILVARWGARAVTGRPFILPDEGGLEAYYGIASAGGFPFHLAEGSDLRLFANTAHQKALGLSVVKEALDDAVRSGGMAREVGSAVARARSWQALGALGSVRDEEIPDCLADLRVLVRELRENHRRPRNSGSLRLISRLLEEEYAPRVGLGPADAGPVPEDEEALGGLGVTP